MSSEVRPSFPASADVVEQRRGPDRLGRETAHWVVRYGGARIDLLRTSRPGAVAEHLGWRVLLAELGLEPVHQLEGMARFPARPVGPWLRTVYVPGGRRPVAVFNQCTTDLVQDVVAEVDGAGAPPAWVGDVLASFALPAGPTTPAPPPPAATTVSLAGRGPHQVPGFEPVRFCFDLRVAGAEPSDDPGFDGDASGAWGGGSRWRFGTLSAGPLDLLVSWGEVDDDADHVVEVGLTVEEAQVEVVGDVDRGHPAAVVALPEAGDLRVQHRVTSPFGADATYRLVFIPGRGPQIPLLRRDAEMFPS